MFSVGSKDTINGDGGLWSVSGNSSRCLDSSNFIQFIKCRAFTCVWQYCILANYFWILMEGLYLHNIVFLAIFNDNSSILTYVLRGWGFPFILVVLWSVARVVEENTLCWTTNNNSIIFWVFIRGPISISIVALGRSTLVFGPSVWSTLRCSFGLRLLNGKALNNRTRLGFFVATLYCLLNEEVRNEIKKFWRRWKPNKPIFKASSFRYPAGFGPKRLVSRLNIRNGDSVKPKVALINSFEMTTYKNDFQETCLNVDEDFEKSLNRANVFNKKNNCEASTHSLGKHFSNEGKDRSYSVETCVLHVSSSSDLQETCLPLISADVEHRPTDHINFPYKDYRSSSMGNFHV
ncbi:Vasoactive intestinal polypeptide receptor 1 [Armadillidium nasatum]|uniref:Vasoactive intestinal polypeptide receptor 1 n=1 Tax=Armadillidium nasatum TaxID=96803 RepID=A0A5N5SPQ0_9CRUS|nr:Vasoactive intestinal polypeptide receptor 1 [Armadillidium nasatum]